MQFQFDIQFLEMFAEVSVVCLKAQYSLPQVKRGEKDANFAFLPT